MKVLLVPDSFKGCLTSKQVCSALEEGILKANPNTEIMQNPSSDGGEGFCECMQNIFGGVYKKLSVTYPMGNKGECAFVYDELTKTAFIELASSCGINLVPKEERSIMDTTTYGLGEQIAEAVKIGAKTIYIGIGGSATNDCGIGLLSALGIRFYGSDNNELPPIAKSLSMVRSFDKSGLMLPSDVKIIAACDVTNPLCGPNGASRVYAAQKGATEEEIEALDIAAASFASVLGVNPNGKGYGAAGGVGMALIAILGATYISGADLLVCSKRFKDMLNEADLLITGEGNSDSQTLNGKLVSVVLKSAKDANVRAFVISGGLSKGYEELYNIGADKCISLLKDGMELDYCIKNASALLSQATERIFSNQTDI